MQHSDFDVSPSTDSHSQPDRTGNHRAAYAVKSDWRRVLLITLLSVLLIVGIVMIYGLIPYRYISNLNINYLAIGQGQSLALSGFNIMLPDMGYPYGAPVVFGLPFTMVQAGIISLFGTDAYLGFILASILFIAVAVAGCVGLMRSLGVSLPVALLFTFIFYSQSFIWRHGGYGQLMFAFAFMPVYLLIDKVFLDRLYQRDRKWYRLIPFILLYFAAKTFSFFMDGYSFIMWSVASGLIFLWYAAKMLPRRVFLQIIIGFLVLGAASAAAYVLYVRYLPGSDNFYVASIDVFRSMSADVYTLLVPIQLPATLESIFKIGPIYNMNQFYGDGSNVLWNYLGYSLLISLIGYLLVRRAKSAFEKGLLAAGAIAFIMALGPSIKINDQRVTPQTGTVTAQDYIMSPEQATIDLGTGFIYTNVPGINIMRAVYRWLLLPKVVLAIAAALFFEELLRRRRLVISGILTALLLIEFLPNFAELDRSYQQNFSYMEAFNQDVIEPLREYIKPGDRLLFTFTDTDYLVSYIVPMLDAISYNVGGDKNNAIAWAHWPQEVREIRRETNITENVTRLLTTDQLDWFVIPLFNLRWDANRWPPSAVDENREQARSLLNFDECFTVIESRYFYLVKLNELCPRSLP